MSVAGLVGAGVAIAFVGSAALLVWKVVGGAVAVRRTTVAQDRALAIELSTLSTEDLRRRLLANPLLATAMRDEAAIQDFVARVKAGDEAALVKEFPRAALYGLLAGAEGRLAGWGRPEALDEVGEVEAVLMELSVRAAK